MDLKTNCAVLYFIKSRGMNRQTEPIIYYQLKIGQIVDKKINDKN